MRLSTKVLFRKFNQIRKQNWSAPTTMSVFIIICMICIFSLESLGLLHKEKNLDYRVTTPESTIKLIHEDKKDNLLNASLMHSEALGVSNTALESLQKENYDHISKIDDILMEAAAFQLEYEDENIEKIIQEYADNNDELMFHDI
jgi:hypothetical protein